MPKEYGEFIGRFEKVVYIAFGSIYQPLKEDADKLIRMIRMADKELPNVGFIFALHENHSSY